MHESYFIFYSNIFCDNNKICHMSQKVCLYVYMDNIHTQQSCFPNVNFYTLDRVRHK